jgi:branched-chain amino acid transport system substrate-binding protein
VKLISKKIYLSFATFGLVALALVGCDTGKSDTASSTSGSAATTVDTGNTIHIGLVASETGPQLPWGKDCIDGAQLAVDQFNKKGGFDGKKVILDVADDASKPEEGKSATEKLIGDDKVLAVIGEVASNITKQMATVCQEKGIPDVAVGATNVDLNKIGNDFFRVCLSKTGFEKGRGYDRQEAHLLGRAE